MIYSKAEIADLQNNCKHEGHVTFENIKGWGGGVLAFVAGKNLRKCVKVSVELRIEIHIFTHIMTPSTHEGQEPN